MKKVSVLIGIGFVDMLGSAMVFPLIPFYALRLHASDWVIGWIIASFPIAQLASAPLWGRVSDRMGRRPALMVGLAASGVAFIVFGFAATVSMLFLSRLVQGAGGGTTGVAQAYIADAIEPRQRTKALGWLSAATNAGTMIGPAIGSLATNLGHAAPGLIAAALCFLNVAFAWHWLPETAPVRRTLAAEASAVPSDRRPAGPPARPRRSVREAMWQVIRHPAAPVSQLIWIYSIGMLGFMSMTGVLALYLERAFGVTERTIGLVFVYTGAVGVIMRALLLGRLTDAFGEKRIQRLGAFSLATGLLLIPLPHSVWTLAPVLGLVPIGTAMLFPATTALTTHLAPDAERGQILGVAQTFGGLSRVIGPIWATAAFQTIGIDVPFFVAAGIVVGGIALAFQVKGGGSEIQVAG